MSDDVYASLKETAQIHSLLRDLSAMRERARNPGPMPAKPATQIANQAASRSLANFFASINWQRRADFAAPPASAWGVTAAAAEASASSAAISNVGSAQCSSGGSRSLANTFARINWANAAGFNAPAPAAWGVRTAETLVAVVEAAAVPVATPATSTQTVRKKRPSINENFDSDAIFGKISW